MHGRFILPASTPAHPTPHHRVMRRVVEILPLSLVPAARPAAAAAKRDAAAICSLPLPDGQMEMAEVARLSRTLGSALGYLALLLDVLSRFLQLPVPHRTAFQGSTSRLWQPEGFFDTRATPPYDALRLCWPPASDGGSALSTLTALAGSAGGGGYGGGAAAAAAAQRQEQQLRAALLALQRAAGMLVYARLGPEAGLRVPEDQAPLTWLAKLCRLLAAETRGGASGGGRTAASSGRDLAASAVLGKGGRDGGTCTPSSRSVLLQGGWSSERGNTSTQPLYTVQHACFQSLAATLHCTLTSSLTPWQLFRLPACFFSAFLVRSLTVAHAFADRDVQPSVLGMQRLALGAHWPACTLALPCTPVCRWPGW